MSARVGGCSEGRNEISAVKMDSSDLGDQRWISRYSHSCAVLLLSVISFKSCCFYMNINGEQDTQSTCYFIPYERRRLFIIQTCILDFYRIMTTITYLSQ